MVTMRYRCLILDHDDTAVDSTRLVHHPAHLRAMGVLRPGVEPVDLETWFAKNFDPGITSYLIDELGFSDEDMMVENQIWREFATTGQPQFYEGFLEAVAAFKSSGGAVVVASHSEEDVIRSHYRQGSNGISVEPDLVFGWDRGHDRRKPNPYPVQEALRCLGLQPRQALVVDDLKPGVDMAQSAGVDVAAACWAHRIPCIRDYMQQHCVASFDTVAEFAEFVLR